MNRVIFHWINPRILFIRHYNRTAYNLLPKPTPQVVYGIL